MPYTHIIAVESMTRDANCVRRDAGIDYPFNVHINKATRHYKELSDYFLNLELETIAELWEFYFYDHVLFGYEFYDFGIEKVKQYKVAMLEKHGIYWRKYNYLYLGKSLE